MSCVKCALVARSGLPLLETRGKQQSVCLWGAKGFAFSSISSFDFCIFVRFSYPWAAS